MPAYTKSMMEAMGEAMENMSPQDVTKPMEQAMDNALSSWEQWTRAGQENTAASLEAMTRQLAEMTTKLADLENQIAELKGQK